MPKQKITDQRIIEACEGRGVDIESATPLELVQAYAGWMLGDPQWADVILAVARNAGMKITDA